MDTLKPLIAITGTRRLLDMKLPGPQLLTVSLTDDYAHGVEHAGGLPLVIPFLEDAATVHAIAERVDGLLLSGGEDVDPALYNDQPRLGLGNVMPHRDWLELELIRAMRAQNKPILGICRGMQVLNAALGGTLYQDLPREWRGKIQHSQQAPRAHASHTVRVEPGSRMASLLGATEVRTNSFHHQAVKVLADGLVPVAWDEEGLIEGAEMPGDDEFVVAIQCHPENLWRTQPEFVGLFRGLVEASTKRVLA
jgi:putative glutamine amidotransferase